MSTHRDVKEGPGKALEEREARDEKKAQPVMRSSRSGRATKLKVDSMSEFGSERTADPRRRGDWLGRGLKKLYQDTLNDPIPDSFLNLLEELDRKDKESKN